MTQQEYQAIYDEFIIAMDMTRLDAYAATGYEWMVVPKTGANRDIKKQHALFIQPIDGIDNDGDGLIDEADELVTKADGGQSGHNFNLARDIVPRLSNGDLWWAAPKAMWKIMGGIAEKRGLTWGGNFKSIKDLPHVECRNFRKVRDSWKRGELDFS